MHVLVLSGDKRAQPHRSHRISLGYVLLKTQTMTPHLSFDSHIYDPHHQYENPRTNTTYSPHEPISHDPRPNPPTHGPTPRLPRSRRPPTTTLPAKRHVRPARPTTIRQRDLAASSRLPATTPASTIPPAATSTPPGYAAATTERHCISERHAYRESESRPRASRLSRLWTEGYDEYCV
jgi:hypothetical protein